MKLAEKQRSSALMDLVFQIGVCYITGGVAASIVFRSIRPFVVTVVATGLIREFFKRLDRMTPG